jgi:hypothetical protein
VVLLVLDSSCLSVLRLALVGSHGAETIHAVGVTTAVFTVHEQAVYFAGELCVMSCGKGVW